MEEKERIVCKDGGITMEFRQLEYFCTISELENFTRTAKVLHVSQPSVTKAIKALEAELGLTLIDRSQKHVTLTDAGRAFLIHARRIMQDAEIAKQDMMRFCVGSAGTVHFGVPPMFEAYLFPEFFKEFREAFPNTLLDVQEFGDSDEVREHVEIGDLDFGVIFGKPETSFANELLIMHDAMSLCLPQGHPLAEKEEVAFESLRRERFILQQPRTYQYRAIFARCIEAGFAPDVMLMTTQLKTIKQLVANGTGISILPDFVLKGEQSFVRRPLTPRLTARTALYWSSHKVFSSLDKDFLTFMKQYVAAGKFQDPGAADRQV